MNQSDMDQIPSKSFYRDDQPPAAVSFIIGKQKSDIATKAVKKLEKYFRSVGTNPIFFYKLGKEFVDRHNTVITLTDDTVVLGLSYINGAKDIAVIHLSKDKFSFTSH